MWIITDIHREHELSLKAELSVDPEKIVFLTRDGTRPAAEKTIELLEHYGVSLIEAEGSHPLERAGAS